MRKEESLEDTTSVSQEGTQHPILKTRLPQVASPHCGCILPEWAQNGAEALASLPPLQVSLSFVIISIIVEE